MTEDLLNKRYFSWMCELVTDKKYSPKGSFLKLFSLLNNITFQYSIAMDGNRAEDGIDLRYRFGVENNHPQYIISQTLDYRPCSVFEMLVALSMRCEEHIMCDPVIGNRTSKWFWIMIKNLGLDSMNDELFDEEIAFDTINRFINRQYDRNGQGGLFIINNCQKDLRTVEIWYQLCWYLNNNKIN